jgi:hypothetical protein
MRVALLTTFVASRKEPVVAMMDRVHQGFLDAGLQPVIHFNFADGGVVSFSSVDRVLKRHPELERFVTEASPAPQLKIPGARRLSNGPLSRGANEAIPYETLQAIAAGVPRSFPFHHLAIHFNSAEFGEPMMMGAAAPGVDAGVLVKGAAPGAAAGPMVIGVIAPGMMAGVLISDNWWVNARQRSLTSCRFTEVEPGAKKLPEPTGPLATVMAACGKPKKTIQAPLPGRVGPGPIPGVRLPTGAAIPSARPEVLPAVKAISVKYRDSMAEIVARAGLPHDLPGHLEMSALSRGVNSGPKKPALERVFKPMGYRVSGGTGSSMGSFHLRRRTAANSTLELSLDTGTWFHFVLAMFFVYGLGWKATVILPPTQKAVAGGQYPIGDAEHWEKVVENLGALVAELERTFVPEVEAVAGPSPEWYQPES